MDPLTQGMLGATAAQLGFTQHLGRRAAVVGLAGGMLADLDVLFTPLADPAMPHELHRHFTHALVFIPVGGLLTALLLSCRSWYRQRFKAVAAAACLAYATHGLLDCFTSYGTLWFWPISEVSVAWDLIAIIDPIFSLVLLIGVGWAAWRNRRGPAAVGLIVAVCYLGLAGVQHTRAAAAQRELAAQRHHTIERSRVMPTLGNTVLWRCVYRADGRLYADAIYVNPIGPTTVQPGNSLPWFGLNDVPTGLMDRHRAIDVLSRFSRFADGYTALAHGSTHVVADMRYSYKTNGFDPMWGIAIDPNNPFDPVRAVHFRRNRDGAIARLWRELTGWP